MAAKRTNLIVLAALTSILLLPNIAIAHPSTGYEPNPLPENYADQRFCPLPEESIDDLIFISPAKPMFLSDVETYMLRGCPDSSLDRPLSAWINEVYRAVRNYHYRFGHLPAQLSPEAIAGAHEISLEQVAEHRLDELLRSPITAEYPFLNRQEFSPGDLYIRILTDSEMRYFADLHYSYQAMWFDGIYPDAAKGETYPMEMTSPVFYVRVYGENDVIATKLMYSWRELGD